MKKILIILLLSLFFNFPSSAQSNGEVISITLSSDLLDADLYYLPQLNLSANQNVNLTGSVTSETSVQILPKPGVGIKILPLSEEGNYAPPGTAARDKKGGTTVIKSKGTGVGRPAPQATIYPNPVQNILTYNTPNNLAINTGVYDMNGVLKITSRTKPASTGTINVGHLPAGHYLLKIDLIDLRFITIQFIKY